ncbi:hypothetical protein [Pseudomonas sp. NPDC089569]|uniref:hypothetical protein n=1 Tax=Pseudomonas sp. NPDC089569 TaxID=3390722 RepID=UPI003D080D43
MTVKKRVSQPKSAYDYGEYNWHFAWSVDVVGRIMTHATGLVFQFKCGAGEGAQPPLGGRCPSGAWNGELRGGEQSLSLISNDQVAIRLCLEALQLFSDMARFACQDCPQDTLGGDYYMVHNDLWNRAHPNGHGMLCLPCLENRVGRPLQVSDFTDAPINSQRRIAEFCGDGAERAIAKLPDSISLCGGRYHDAHREELLNRLRGYLGTWTMRLWLRRWRIRLQAHQGSIS